MTCPVRNLCPDHSVWVLSITELVRSAKEAPLRSHSAEGAPLHGSIKILDHQEHFGTG